jgi:hypothetical protein
MTKITLSDQEVEALRVVLQQIVIKSRTGELGILHGIERFVSTKTPLKREMIAYLDSLASKVNVKIGRYGQ